MARRGRGEGSIYKRSDGRWEARVSIGYQGDRRVRKAFYGRTRAEAHARMQEALREGDAGLDVNHNRRMTVAAFLGRWLSEVARPSVRASTMARYAEIVRLHVTPTRAHPLELPYPLATFKAS